MRSQVLYWAAQAPKHHVAWPADRPHQEELQSQLGHTGMPSGHGQDAAGECIVVTIKVAQYDEVEAVCWWPLPS